MEFRKITKDNLAIASKVQNEIFPMEDGTENFIECIEKNPYRKEMDYYLVYVGNVPMGVTGIYSYHEYPEDAWLAWFGVLPNFRNQGYGGLIFDWTVLLAKEKGYQSLRLYSDETFRDAHQLYKKKGMISEVYDNPEDKDPYEPKGLITYIFSMSLTDKKICCWNHKKLGLKEQGIKEHFEK